MSCRLLTGGCHRKASLLAWQLRARGDCLFVVVSIITSPATAPSALTVAELYRWDIERTILLWWQAATGRGTVLATRELLKAVGAGEIKDKKIVIQVCCWMLGAG